MYSGNENSVEIPLGEDIILIGHTHPKGTEYASSVDLRVMSLLKAYGSKQNVSEIYPVGKQKIRFDRKNRRLEDVK